MHEIILLPSIHCTLYHCLLDPSKHELIHLTIAAVNTDITIQIHESQFVAVLCERNIHIRMRSLVSRYACNNGLIKRPGGHQHFSTFTARLQCVPIQIFTQTR